MRDVQLATAVLAAEDMYATQGAAAIEPALDARISSEWELRGYITGVDAIFRRFGKFALGDRRVFYGLVLESKCLPGDFAAIVRGTSSWVEWVEDAEGLPERGRLPGRTEAGFTGIYDTFQFRAPGGADAPLGPALTALASRATLAVAGHSLGSALATYLAHDAALALPGRITLRVWASPHAGDSEFVRAVATAIPDHIHYRNPKDIVPKVPIALGYEHLPKTVDLGPSTETLEIKSDFGCSHHLLSYIALMDESALDAATADIDKPCLQCIIRHA